MFARMLPMASVCCVLAHCGAAEPPRATDQTTPSPKAASSAIAQFQDDARDYVIRLDARPKADLELREEPLFHWGNPARTGEDGVVFVWLLDGRPEVIGAIFTYRLGKFIHRKHEYHSLALGPLAAQYRGRRVWAPRIAGVAFQRVPDAPAPAATARLRLSQMKTLARNFSARMEALQGEKFELRLLPQPLLRYEPKDQNILDGALFSFSLGTDPEAILVLEARVEDAHAAWQYAFARFHFVDLHASYNDQEVWHVEAMPEDITVVQLGSPKYQDSVYATYHVAVAPVEE
jgi:hypothetical protein